MNGAESRDLLYILCQNIMRISHTLYVVYKVGKQQPLYLIIITSIEILQIIVLLYTVLLYFINIFFLHSISIAHILHNIRASLQYMNRNRIGPQWQYHSEAKKKSKSLLLLKIGKNHFLWKVFVVSLFFFFVASCLLLLNIDYTKPKTIQQVLYMCVILIGHIPHIKSYTHSHTRIVYGIERVRLHE